MAKRGGGDGRLSPPRRHVWKCKRKTVAALFEGESSDNSDYYHTKRWGKNALSSSAKDFTRYRDCEKNNKTKLWQVEVREHF